MGSQNECCTEYCCSIAHIQNVGILQQPVGVIDLKLITGPGELACLGNRCNCPLRPGTQARTYPFAPASLVVASVAKQMQGVTRSSGFTTWQREPVPWMTWRLGSTCNACSKKGHLSSAFPDFNTDEGPLPSRSRSDGMALLRFRLIDGT